MDMVFQVAGHRFGVSGERVCKAVGCVEGFTPFAADGGDVLFSFVEGKNAPEMKCVQYEFVYEDVTGTFGKTENGYMIILEMKTMHTYQHTVISINQKMMIGIKQLKMNILLSFSLIFNIQFHINQKRCMLKQHGLQNMLKI